MALKQAAPHKYLSAFANTNLELWESDGVPTESGPKKGALAVDTTNGKLYINTGTASSATWNAVGDIAASEITLARGSILRGNASGVAEALDGKTAGRVLIGDGVDVISTTITGDASLSGAGALTLGSNVVTMAKFGRSDAIGKVVIGQGAGADSAYTALTGDVTIDGAGITTTTKVAGAPKQTQATPTAKTTSATLTANEVLAGIITVNQGGGATSAQQLPTVTDLETALVGEATNDAFDFSVINISTVAAEDASITTNTGWTLVGNMDIASNAAATDKSAGMFRARKTGASAWTLYRIS